MLSLRPISRQKTCWAAFFLTLSSLPVMAVETYQAQADDRSHPVAADVNGVKIMRKEVDHLYSQQAAPNLPPEIALARKRAILAELVRAEVLAQKAVENKLDQSPDFEMEMAMSRRSLLAGKVERQILGGATRVTAQQAVDFVNSNPRLFAERQLLTLEVMNLNTPDASLVERLDQAAENGAGFEKMERLVREARGDSLRKVVQNSSDSLPPELLKALTAKPYKAVVIKFNDNPQRGIVMMVRSAIPAPLSGNEAVLLAGNLLQRRQLESTRTNGINALVNAAKVSYFGLFQGVQAGGVTSLDADLVGGSLYAAPVSRTRKIAIAAGVAAASTLLVLLWLASWRYWTGNARQSGLLNWLQRMPLLNKLVPRQRANEALAQALAAASSRHDAAGAAWYGKLLVLLCLAGSLGLLWLQSVAAWKKLPHWVMAGAGTGGLALGLVLAWIWLRSGLGELGKNRRWLPVPILGLLTLGASSAAMMMT